jgi:hypothetical protein
MQLPYKYIAAAFLALIVVLPAQAVTVAKTRTVDVNSNEDLGATPPTRQSPYFTLHTDGVTPISPSTNGWAPASPATAGAATSISPRGVITLNGNATSAGNWVDGNGIPAGLMLSLTAQFTISVGPNAPAGSFLTLSTADVGNGLGLTQVEGTVSQLEAGEQLQMSEFTVTDVAFSGVMTEPGFTVGTPSVTSFGTRVFRSAAFNGGTLTTEKALLTSAGGTVGFAHPTQQPYGDVSSNIGNNFSNTFPVQAGPYTLDMVSGAMGLKGIGFSYDYTYDINPTVVADNADFDGDLDVDGVDFLTWQGNFGTELSATRSQGNANPTVDGAVDATDLSLWTAQFGTAPNVAAAANIPEPSGLLLSLGAGGALLARLRGRRVSRG